MTVYKLNPSQHGIELYFDEKPAPAVLENLKENRWRWHRQKKCWYARQTPENMAIAEAIAAGNLSNDPPENAAKMEKTNKFGVKVGDLFYTSWGYDQTNVEFFQVIALVGESSVRVREVCPPCLERESCPWASEDRVYQTAGLDILPPAEHAAFIKDQEHGDLKRLKSYAGDGKSHPQFYLTSYASAHLCEGETTKQYVSWYA